MMFNIVAIIGPSGSGKTTVQKYLGIKRIITYTSREPRKVEIDGVHYHFTTREKILAMKDNGYLFEYTEYNGNLYSSALKSIQEVIENGKIGSIVVDVNGARELKEKYDERILLMGILASKDECAQRLNNRRDSNAEKRLALYDQEVIGMLGLCDLIINNSRKNWPKNKTILNWVRKGLIPVDSTMTL